MKKALLVFMALVVPFFSHANIYDDAIKHPPKSSFSILGDCIVPSGIVLNVEIDACKNHFDSYYRTILETTFYNVNLTINEIYSDTHSRVWSFIYTYEVTAWIGTPDEGKIRGVTYSQRLMNNIQNTNVNSCPPESYPSFTMEYGQDNDGNPTSCIDPNNLALLDSCDINDTLNVQVTDVNACYSKPDGSLCSVTAVDVGGGNQVYMGSEGDCYTDPKPDISENQTIGSEPITNECTNNGGLLTCPEDPANVCGTSGTTYGGGSVNNCQSGCGYVNDAFVCYDIDTDGDGLPDYNDPDIDGDGIKNSDDFDSNGDGIDDPINGGATGTSSGAASLKIDLTPVVSELKKLNDQFKVTEVKALNQDGELDLLNNDYQTKLTEFSSKTATELGYTDSLNLANSGVLSSAIPTETCQNYSIPVGFFGNFTLDTCSLSSKVQPLLTWFFGLLTAWYIFFLINRTLSEGF